MLESLREWIGAEISIEADKRHARSLEEDDHANCDGGDFAAILADDGQSQRAHSKGNASKPQRQLEIRERRKRKVVEMSHRKCVELRMLNQSPRNLTRCRNAPHQNQHGR